jgi:hypothetical protein
VAGDFSDAFAGLGAFLPASAPMGLIEAALSDKPEPAC